MIDRLNGRRMGLESTSSSRRQSYKFEPTSRMTNTYIAAGMMILTKCLKELSEDYMRRKWVVEV